ncbi:MAG: Gfo/Idh/MocA family oxidoreductase [Prolixibacteraceae bacterium]|jgi:predicted dehydrogenase|nr:Gfo/Idh/MocA family oxidoreductase [Prolixibacteraceae bacterium]MBT6766824.1 Gfo/Idh/MocA family oxidoreductase [Prolixibacteraceae bacterium]MBT6996945.1 Gfo/Idh/MocA family oxidoreductase [Prolixibacteraceae bacterium]MBT7396997.1 Gfo/Idh/MocA family oxidoreductase [Prolixibacteraceae bacterium]
MTNRRNFIKKSALATAGFGLAASTPMAMNSFKGANEKLVCGLIGAKGMGFSDLQAFLRQPNTECAAICDVDENVLNERIADTEKIQGTKPKGFKDFRKLLEEPGIDVIIIGTPDHWHTIPFVNAAQEGKHIYCEKPLANSIEEINIMERAAAKYGNVVQVGQWQRSDTHWQKAIEFVHSGALGKIRTVRTWSYQGWMKSVPVVVDSAPPAGVDYDFWLGPAKKQAFNKNRFHFTFRWFWDYAGGMMTDWGVHIIDYALFGMKAKAPKSVMSMGGKFAYPDDACETPDTQQALYDFDGYTMLWDHGIGIDGGYYGRSHGVGFVGNNGTLVVDRGGWEVIPEGGNNPAMERVELQKGDGQGLNNHMKNFIDCIKDPSISPNANIGIAANTARVCHLGNVAFKTGRRLYWDADNSKFIGDEDANQLLTPIYRAPWKLPVV